MVRPFAGLASEPDWIAMRELVPAGTAPLMLTGEFCDREVMVSTLLPMAWPALVRADGRVVVAVQLQTGSSDLSRDIGDALHRALTAEPGSAIPPRPTPAHAPRLHDLIDVDAPLRVSVHSTFDYWVEDPDQVDDAVRASLDAANEAVIPTARLAGVDGAYWVMVGSRRQLRWVLPQPEDVIVDALARIDGDTGLPVMPGARYLGSFRALGLVVPVWDLPEGTEVEDVEGPAATFDARLTAALAHQGALSGDERRRRSTLLARQLTLH